MKLPRVLVVSPVRFNQQAGGGVTMGNLFRGWPLDSIAQIYSSLYTKADHTVCTNYLFLQATRARRQISIRPRDMATLAKQIFHFALGQQKRLGHWTGMKKVLRWSRQFRPDIIYTHPQDTYPFYWSFPRQLAQILGIPYITHIMDDWPARYEAREGFINNFFLKPFLRENLQSLFDEAAFNIGISEEMGKAYRKRYGRTFVPFHNCINVSEWSSVKKSYHMDGKFRLVYLGVVTEDKELQSLMDIRDAVISIGQKGYPISMLIYSAPQWENIIRKHLEQSPWVVYKGYVYPADLPKTLSKADLLILPINFDSRSLTYVGYSLQTKVPEYMASGTPILAYGPPMSPNIRYAAREGWGRVVDHPDKTVLGNTIMRLMKDQNLRVRLGQRARDLAFRNHDAAVIRQRFRHLISKAAFGSFTNSDRADRGNRMLKVGNLQA